MYVGTGEQDEFDGQQGAVYFRTPSVRRHAEGQPSKGCPEESSTLLTMAETARPKGPNVALREIELYLAVGM